MHLKIQLCRFGNTLLYDSKIISDYIFGIYSIKIVFWKSEKQTILAESKMESKMITLATTSEEASLLQAN
jgi:hypothetical protein